MATYNLLFYGALMARQGMGYTLCLDGILDTPENSGLCFRPLFPPVEAKMNLIWRKNRPLTQAAELFRDKIEALA